MKDYEALSVIVSFAALIISVVVAILQNNSNNKTNRISIEAEYFSDIYKEYLIKKIPIARKKLHFEKDVLTGIDELCDLLKQMRSDSLYFEFRNRNFYDELKQNLQTLEDYLIETVNKGKLLNYQQDIFYKQVNTYLETIYKHITNAHFG